MKSLLHVSLLALALVGSGHAHNVWDDRTNQASFDYTFTGAAYGAGRFLMLGHNVSGLYHVSSTGRTGWTTQQWPETLINPNGVAFGKGLFVMVGGGGSIYTSPTGLTGSWTQRSSGMSRSIRCVRFLNNMFVAGADRYNDPGSDPALSYTEVLTSPTGESWTSHKFPASGATLSNTAYTITDFGFKPAAGGKGVWVLGANVTNTCLSANESFTTLLRDGVIAVGGDQRIAFGGGMFVITSETGGIGKIWYSATGVGWTQAILPGGMVVEDMTGVFHDGFRFVACGSTIMGSSPSRPALLHSTDGINWSQAATVPNTEGDLQFVTRLDGLWMTGGSGKTLLTSGTSSVGLGEIEVQSPVDTDLADGVSTLAFDPVNMGQNAIRTIRIRNTGIENFTGISVAITGTHATDFTKSALAASLAPGAFADFTLTFAPKGGGARTAALRINSNDADEKAFDVGLTGTGIAPPTAKTLAAAPIGNVGATLNGTVNAKGTPCQVWFDYGTTAALGTTVAGDPAALNNSDDTAVTAALTGLASHTKYHYRVRATGESGGIATGATMAFTTANTSPVGVADAFEVTIASTVLLDVLQNDVSPDGDALSVLSNTALVPSSAGKLTKSGNTFVFAASSIFNGASFIYMLKDAFGGVSGPITVTLTQGLCGIDPDIVDHPAAAISYPVTLTTDAMWSVDEKLSWLTVSPASGMGNGTVTITLQPNTAQTERSGTVIIGGYPHDITQSGVIKPTLQMPAPIPQGIVSGYYELLIPTTNFPVTYTVTNMPPGLTINASTGLISGTPTKAGKYNVTVKAKNAAGSADLSPTFEIEILALPAGVVGAFHGFVDPHPTINGNLGSRLELTTTKTGSYSGKLITGGTSTTLKGILDADPDFPNQPACVIEFPRAGVGPLIMELVLSHDAHSILGTITDDDTLESTAVRGWRNVWGTAERATQYGGLYTFILEPTNPGSSLPQGYGFGSFKLLSETTGNITVSGKLADGNTFTCATFIGANGQVLVYQALYGGKGSLAGLTGINLATPAEESNLNNLLSWTKPPPAANSKDTVYKPGFGPLTLNVKGGRHPELPAGGLVMNLESGENNAFVEFADGGLDTEGKEFGVTFTIQNPSATGKTNKAVIPTNPNKLTMPVLNTATGAFSGDFTLAGATTAQNRKVPYQGQIVRAIDGIRGYGYFILPESTAATATRWSGNVLLRNAK